MAKRTCQGNCVPKQSLGTRGLNGYPHRVEQLVDFARFLEAQILSEEFMREEDVAEIEADNMQWDTLLATDEAQILLDQLADEALAEHRADKTKSMTFNDEGQIASE